MISYSDYVLAEKPWAYWDLSDPSISGVYQKENQFLLDISGNNRHLVEIYNQNIVSYHNKLLVYNYTTNFNGNLYSELTVPVDSVPIIGVDINDKGNIPTGTVNYNIRSYITMNKNFHVNDVTLEDDIKSHNIYHNKIRFECLLFLPQKSCKTNDKNPNCKPVKYPMLNIGGMSLWVETQYDNPGCTPIRNCPDCLMGSSRIQLYYNVNVDKIHKTDSHLNRYYTDYYNIIPDMGIMFPIGANIDWTRIIVECEYVNDKSIHFKYWQKNGLMFDQVITLPEVEDIGDYFVYTTFSYLTSWDDLKIQCARGISNLSLYFDRNSIDDSYVTKTWQALTTDYIPQLHQDTIRISSQHLTNIKFESLPNTTQKQLDSLLIRGINHQRFSIITTEDWNRRF